MNDINIIGLEDKVDRWKGLFTVENKGADLPKSKFPLSTTQPKTEALRRLSYIVKEDFP